MKHSKVLAVTYNKRWFLLLYAILFVAKVSCDDDQPQPAGMTPSAGLLCVSDCATCPVICSPPTSPVNSKPPPSPSPPLPRPPTPPVHYSPSQPYFHAPPPFLFPLPLPPEASPPPPPPPPTPTPPPPASYVSWSNVAPPPPSIYYWGGGGGGGNVPSVQAPPGMGQRNYSYPYYYFYASKASSFSLQGSSIFVLLLSLHVLYFS